MGLGNIKICNILGYVWERKFINVLMKQNAQSCDMSQNFLFSKYNAVFPLLGDSFNILTYLQCYLQGL